MSNLTEPITEVINENQPIGRCPRGRPKKYFSIEEIKQASKEYNKEYYKNNKEKFNKEYHCKSCNIICDYGNKSRHNISKFHLDNLKVIS